MPGPQLSPRQEKWFASVRAGLESGTGRSLAEWVAIARECPESGHRARLAWMKEKHGLPQNRASLVLSEAFEAKMAWSEPRALIEALWTDLASKAIFEAVDAAALSLPGAIQTARKGYTAWARQYQFAALRPVRGGGAMLGLAVAPDAEAGLEAPRNESWSERLKSRLALGTAALPARVVPLLKAAWEKS